LLGLNRTSLYYQPVPPSEEEILPLCPVPDIINIATRRGIGSNGQDTEELYARVQTQSGAGKHAA
jgi:hypothetical protein